MKIIKSYIEFLNEKILFKSGRNFDLPATSMDKINKKSTDTVILDIDDEGQYPFKIKDKTHGLESHAIKHLHEIDREYFKNKIIKAMFYIKNKSEYKDMGIIDVKGDIVIEGDIIDDINVLNTMNLLDFINDKKQINEPLNEDEKYLYENVILPISKRYEQIIEDTINKSKKISEVLIKNKNVVSFNGILKDSDFKFYYDINNKFFIMQNKHNGDILTAYKIYSNMKKHIDNSKRYLEPEAEALLRRFII